MTQPTFLGNFCFWSAASAWTLAQLIKFINRAITHHELDFYAFVSTGGMPSAHSALVSALATAVGLRSGFGTPLFAVTAIFAAVVMFDAQSVRRAAGQQARILNRIVHELLREHHLTQHKLAELLGHTRIEVFVGLLLGVLVAFALFGRWA